MRIMLSTLLVTVWLALPAHAQTQPPEPSPAAAEMLQSMREKGILSEQEYEDLYRRQAKYEEEQRLNESLPGWLQNWTFGGDARMRFERIDRQDLDLHEPLDPKDNAIDLITLKAKGDESRYRTRFRIGAEKKIEDGVTFGFQIATATEFTFSTQFADSLVLADTASFGRTILDHRSQNEDFNGYFQPLQISLSRVYIEYQPTFAPALSLYLGKFANPFVSKYWRDGDRLIWDPDINPSGAAFTYHFDFIPETLWLDSAAGAFILDQHQQINVQCTTAEETTCSQFFPVPDANDPFMLGGQIGLSGRPWENVQLGVRVTF